MSKISLRNLLVGLSKRSTTSLAPRNAGAPIFRQLSTESTAKEKEMHEVLQRELDATSVKVTDISGGCGSMYRIEVASPKFDGVNRVGQHRMVNEILKEEIGQMHGLTLKTSVPTKA